MVGFLNIKVHFKHLDMPYIRTHIRNTTYLLLLQMVRELSGRNSISMCDAGSSAGDDWTLAVSRGVSFLHGNCSFQGLE